MKADLVRVTACSLGLMLLPAAASPPAAAAQSMWAQVTPGNPPAPSSEPAPPPAYLPQQLDQLLAPIALYPDPLLAQILMASTYPLEVVEAARWLQDRNNAALRDDQLDAALEQQDWDPSVKSLVPFPQILQMMNSRLDWTQSLGNAFLAQQADVMDSVQRLRAEARAAGTLQSTPQQTVSTEGQTITVEPANPQLVYVPYYDPRLVYGGWGYPDYPPDYFPPPLDYGYVEAPGIYFGIGLGVIGALWGWDRWDWGHHDIHIDPDRFNRINRHAIARDHRPRFTENTWQHDPAHRRGVPYRGRAVRQKFQPAAAGSAGARRDFRGFDTRGGAAPNAVARPAETGRPTTRREATGRAGAPPIGQRGSERGRAGQAVVPARPAPPANARVAPPPVQRAPAAIGRAPPAAAVQRPAAPAFSNFGSGAEVRVQSQRGQASRQSMPAPRIAAPAPRAAAPAPQQRSAPAGGGQRGGGHDRQRR